MSTLNIRNITGELIESHEFEGSLMDWINENVPSFNGSALFEATINGQRFDYSMPLSNKIVDLIIKPRWAAVPWVIAVLAAGAAYQAAKKFDNQYQESAQAGRSIYSANAKANTLVPSGIVREAAGRPTIYPDLICPPHRSYTNHVEYLHLMLCVGAGYYDILEDNIYISETPINRYVGDVTVSIFEPGDTVSGHEAHENWYQSKEVQDLRLTTEQTPEYGSWEVEYSGATITSYRDGALTTFPFQVGEDFELIGGTNPGYYQVSSLGSPNSTATVIGLDRTGGDTGRLEVTTQYARALSGRPIPIRRNIFTSSGAPAFTVPSPIRESITWTGVNGGVKWNGPYVLTPENETAQYSEVDVVFPQGLSGLDGNNEETNATVEIEIQWRAYGTSSWTTVSSTSYTEATFDERAYTVDIDFGSAIRPEMRFRRVTKDSDDIQTADIVEIKRVKCKLETPTSYSDVTTIALKLKGTNTLATTAENKINVRGATRKLPTIAELEAGSWDLTAATTQTDTGYIITDAEFISSSQLTGIGENPDSGGSDVSGDIGAAGTKIVTLTANSGIARFTHLTSAYEPTAQTYSNGFLFLDVGMSHKEVRFSGNDTYVDYLYQAPSTLFYMVSQPITLPSSTGEVAENGSFTGYQLPIGITDAVSFYMYPNGTKYWVIEGDGLITTFNVSSAHDLTTSSQPSPVVTYDASAELGVNNAVSIWATDYSSGTDPARVYIADDAGNIFQYTMATPGDISTLSYDNVSFVPQEQVNSIHVTSEKLFALGVASADGFASIYNLQDVVDTRATRSVCRYVGHMLYEAMGSDAQTLIDWDEMDTLDTLLESRGDYLDGEFVDETTLYEAVKLCLAVGYSEPTIKEGVFTPVRIAASSDYSHLYTPDVMIGDGLRVETSHYDNQEPDGVDVEYFSLSTNSMEVVECRTSGYAGIRPKRIQAFGITDEAKAWRFGMREWNEMRLKPATYTFETEMDALNSNYGDRIAVASELFTSQCGEVTAYSAPSVTVDFTPTFGAGTHYAAFRNREGAYSGLYTVTQGSPNNVLTISSSPSSLDFTPVTDGSMDSTFMSFGTEDEWAGAAIVRRITPQSDNIVQVIAQEYVAGVFADDDNSPS